MAFTKQELAEKISKRLCLTKVAGKIAVDIMLEDIAAALVAGEQVRLSGIGTLRLSDRKEHYSNNPAGGEKVFVPAYKTVVLKCSKALKDAINNR